MRSLVVLLSALLLLLVGAALVAWIVVGGVKGLGAEIERSCEPNRHNKDDTFCYDYDIPSPPPRQ
ncbi:hypothetical protein [Glycomyces algeriensis]|nr:hypothetical protein [Glycomyces algeriensis]MDA1365589.1 hypothetical protein [Glycomyces algeriensis]MDR7351277.1 hypothetical protein [Glycomyces algeriensis]